MWEKPRIDGKKKLKSNAIPTIFEKNKEKDMKTALLSIHNNGMDSDFCNVSSITIFNYYLIVLIILFVLFVCYVVQCRIKYILHQLKNHHQAKLH